MWGETIIPLAQTSVGTHQPASLLPPPARSTPPSSRPPHTILPYLEQFFAIPDDIINRIHQTLVTFSFKVGGLGVYLSQYLKDLHFTSELINLVARGIAARSRCHATATDSLADMVLKTYRKWLRQ